MSKKKNYSKMFNEEAEQTVVETPVEAVEETPVEQPVVTPKKPEMVNGTVVNCTRLNVREQMNTSAAVLCVIQADDKVKVFADENHEEWVHVITDDGVEGFCMKKYIATKQ